MTNQEREIKREITLKRLRQEHQGEKTGIEDLPYPEYVKMEIEEIQKTNPELVTKDWGERCQARRKDCRMTAQQAAIALDVNPKTIWDQERKKGLYRVEPFYLEAFSYLYHTTPKLLLLSEMAQKKMAVWFLSSTVQEYEEMIINALYDPNCPKKIRYLEWITIIGRMKQPTRTRFFRMLESQTQYAALFSTEPEGDSKKQHPEPDGKLCYADRDRWEYECRYALLEARMVLDQLVIDSKGDLRILAQMALAGDTFLDTLLGLLVTQKPAQGHNTLRPTAMDGYVTDVPDGVRDLRPGTYAAWFNVLRSR